MDCEHGWRNAMDCDACTRARVLPEADARISKLEAALREIAATYDETPQTPKQMAAALYAVSMAARVALQTR